MNIGVVKILDKFPFHYYLTIVIFLTFTITLYKLLYTTNKNPVPSPRKLPIIGNLHQLGTLPHRSLRALSRKYGDLMLLHLGSKPTLVVSSPLGAEEIMKTHDLIFSNRAINKVVRIIFYNGKDIAFSKYGEYWRRIKGICVMNLLNKKKVESFRKIREEEVCEMINDIQKSTLSTVMTVTSVDLTASFIKLANNLMCRAVFGRKYDGTKGGVDIKEVLDDLSVTLGAFLFGEIIPWLGWIDRLSGVLSKATNVAKKLDMVIEESVKEHMNAHNMKEVDKEERTEYLIDVLLQVLRDDPSLEIVTLKAIIMDMLVAGIETTVTVLEWTMSELFMHPKIMKKLQAEVRQFLKDNKTIIDEDDLKEMNYLKAVIKETLRLHPPGPFLLLREPSEDTKVQNYDIAVGTQVIINVWAIQRHPSYWDEPEEFCPERFLDSVKNTEGIEKGNGFEFIPFGEGRRSCPGMSFANVIVELALANVVGKFDWKCDQVDETSFMAETFGAAVHKEGRLLGIPTQVE